MKRLAVLGLATLLMACGGADSQVINTQSTMGEELLDLKKAYEAGAITERDYERAKRRILKGQR
ncbi:MAG: SHOCT domain-containing protein [Alphaproteobacteria bacterium]